MKFKRPLLAILLIFCEVGCESHNVVEIPNLTNNKGYYLYVGNWGFDEVFIVDTDNNTVIDTLRGFGSVWDLTITKSGAKLYVCNREGPVNFSGKVFSVDLHNMQIKLILNKVADVYAAPHGAIFIISKDPYQLPRQIGIIDTMSDAITYFDTLDIRDTGYNYQSVIFDKNRPLVYAVNSDEQLFAYNYEKKQIVRIYRNLFDPLHLVISPDGKFLYVAGGPVFDLGRDSVIAWVGGNQLGSLALSSRGEYLYITDPGKYMLPEPVPTGKVKIFQTHTNNYLGEIDVNKATGEAYTLTDGIVVMPDGKTAYVSNWLHRIFVIDLQLREVIKVIYAPGFTVPMVLGKKL